jgi:peptidoglycan/xylan/chitin deacetylase (PgdA/CDA1 family)
VGSVLDGPAAGLTRLATEIDPMPPWKSLLLSAYYHASRPGRARRNAALARQGRLPITVLFYHRIADDGAGGWTFPTATFVRHIRWLSRRFEIIPLAEVQRRVQHADSRRPAVAITFDDGYAANWDRALPLLIARRLPCTYFVSVAHVLEGRPFPHDVALGRPLAPNTLDELRQMAAAGIDIGCHTRTHADLGRIDDPATLRDEVVAARDDLVRALGRPVRYFAFPFGQRVHLSRLAFQVARDAGYEGACSAYGGYNAPGDDPFHVQRVAADVVMARVKNWTTIDPRKLATPRFDPPPAARLERLAGAAP